MKYDSINKLFQFEDLSLKHAITTRHSFTENDFNLSFHTGNRESVIANRDRLQAYFVGNKFLTIPKQCHQAHIFKVTESCASSIPEDTDALITNTRGHVLGVLSADCVPVLLHDPVNQVLGLAHAGWKGTVASIAPLTALKMVQEYGSVITDIKVYIGPSISQANFEVGEEVVSHFNNMDLHDVILTEQGKSKIDLWKANAILIMRLGVLDTNIKQANVCTVDGVNHFYSARKEGFGTGRFGFFAML